MSEQEENLTVTIIGHTKGPAPSKAHTQLTELMRYISEETDIHLSSGKAVIGEEEFEELRKPVMEALGDDAE